MHAIDGQGHEDQRFTEGGRGGGPGTAVTADWLNAVQDELIAILQAAGIEPSKADNRQVVKALTDLMFRSVSQIRFGAVGDGTTDDTAAFLSLEDRIKGREVDLAGRTYSVKNLPSQNVYRNGRFSIAEATYDVAGVGALISSATDTGSIEPVYTGGVEITGFAGRSTPHNRALLAAQNCRSTFARSVNVASIYCEANANVSGNYSARGSRSNAPQGVNLATEECQVDGFRGANVSALLSRIEGLGGGNYGTRRCTVSAREALNLASVDAVAGDGQRAKLRAVVQHGVVRSIDVIEGGRGYMTTPAIQVQDRVGQGVGAEAIAVVEAGAVVRVTVQRGGRDYSAVTDATLLTGGAYSANLATTNDCRTTREAAVNIAANRSHANGPRSANLATDECNTLGPHAANIASRRSVAQGQQTCNIASTESSAVGIGSVTLSGLQLEAAAPGTVVIGRRTRSETAGSLVLGDAAVGPASTTNRKFEVTREGRVTAAGALSGSAHFADYAEFFENEVKGSIPLGTIVTHQGARVRPARLGEFVLGIVSATAFIAAGDSPFQWAHRYLRGDFGEVLFDEVDDPEWTFLVPDMTWQPRPNESESERPQVANHRPCARIRIPRANPDFDQARENCARSDRPEEWTCVGLLGQLHVRIDDSVRSGDSVVPCDNGIGKRGAEGGRLRCLRVKLPFDAQRGYGVGLCLMH